MIELTKAPCDSILEIKSLSGRGWQNRLESMGLRKGRRLKKIVCQPFVGPIVVEMQGAIAYH